MKQKRKFLPTAPYPKTKKKSQKVRKYDTRGAPLGLSCASFAVLCTGHGVAIRIAMFQMRASTKMLP